MNPPSSSIPHQGPRPSSVIFTFTGSPVLSKADSLEQLMKSEEYKAYKDDVKSLNEYSVEIIKLYFGAIIAVATGVFIVTISVVKELTTWSYDCVLGIAWGSTTLAVVCAFVGLLVSQFASKRELGIMEWRLEAHDYKTEHPNVPSDWNRRLTVTTCITLALGVVLSATFIFLNRRSPRRNNESGSSTTTKSVADSSSSSSQRPSGASPDGASNVDLPEHGKHPNIGESVHREQPPEKVIPQKHP